MGQDTVPHNTNTVTFCNAILTNPGLATFQADLKALVGNVDPTSHTTIVNTQPSVGDMQTFVNNTQVWLNAGDASVPIGQQSGVGGCDSRHPPAACRPSSSRATSCRTCRYRP